MDLIYPYIRNRGVFICPSARNIVPYTYFDPNITQPSYGYNQWVSGAKRESSYPNTLGLPFGQPLKTSQIRRPSEAILSMDYDTVFGVFAGLEEFSQWAYYSNLLRLVVAPHKGTNFLFADGHVQWYPVEDSQVTLDPNSATFWTDLYENRYWIVTIR
jgi:prepilin-type processing-associated H-X9-DG protein